MLTFLRSRSRGQLIAFVLVALVGAAGLVALGLAERAHRPGTNPAQQATAPTTVAAAPGPSPTPPSTTYTTAPLAHPLPRTASADEYAAAVAEALWNLDYTATPRDAFLGFWREQLSAVLPAGTPAGTTLGQAQAAAMSTISDYLPSAAMWVTLASDHTMSSFTVTGVSEPPSWVEAVTSGAITDPGLTAREVIGVQKLIYGTGADRRTTMQTQQLIVAMLCPPSTEWCTVEIFAPRDATGAAG